MNQEELIKSHKAILNKLAKCEAFIIDYLNGNVSRRQMTKRAIKLLAEGGGGYAKI